MNKKTLRDIFQVHQESWQFCHTSQGLSPNALNVLPVDPIPWSWVVFPCVASPRRLDRGCWNPHWGEEDGTASPGPAGQTAKADCPSPTLLGPPILPSGRGPWVSQHTTKVKLEHSICFARKKTDALPEELDSVSCTWSLLFLTLMPSLAPSCRYGIMEWFQRSMNQDRNSSTVTGHDRKKHGPKGKKEMRTFNNGQMNENVFTVKDFGVFFGTDQKV